MRTLTANFISGIFHINKEMTNMSILLTENLSLPSCSSDMDLIQQGWVIMIRVGKRS